MRVPPQQQGGKARAEGGGRQQVPSIPNCSHIPRRQTRPVAHLQTAPRMSEGEDHIESCPHPTPGRDHLGSCHKDAADLHPGTFYSAAEYCAPVWCRSSHTKQLDTVLNSAMRTVAGLLRPTPVNQLPILAGIAPPTIRPEAAVLALTRKAAKDEDHILHLVISERPSPARLKSRRPFAEHAHRLLRSTPEDVSSRSWLSTRWNEEWRDAEHSRLHSFINTPYHVPGQDLPRRQWTTYNRIRTGVGRFGEAMKRWGLKSTSECECGAPNQSVQHIMDDCTMHRPPNGERGLTDLDEDTRIWLASTSLGI